MKRVTATLLNRQTKDTAVLLKSQVFFTSELSTRLAFMFILAKQYNVYVCVFVFLYRYIIGKKGETRKRLESNTKTSISIPKQGVEGQIGEDSENLATIKF